MLWLILAGLLVMHLDEEIGLSAPLVMTAMASSPWDDDVQPAGRVLDEADPRPDLVESIAEAEAQLDVDPRGKPPPVADHSRFDETVTNSSERSQSEVRTADDHHPVPRALLDAFDEPIATELQALFDAIMASLAEQPAALDPAIQRHAVSLASRINGEGQPYALRFHDPIIDLARRRAVYAHALLVDLGLRPWLLETSAQHGHESVSAFRANR